MWHRLHVRARALRRAINRQLHPATPAPAGADPRDAPDALSAEAAYDRLATLQRATAAFALAAASLWFVLAHPPVRHVGPGEVGIRTNQLTGEVTQWTGGRVLVIPGFHELRVVTPDRAEAVARAKRT